MDRLGVEKIERTEYVTLEPPFFGAAVEPLSFAPEARHRSGELAIYRSDPMDVIDNAESSAAGSSGEDLQAPRLSAIACTLVSKVP